MKKAIVFGLAAALTLSLAGCMPSASQEDPGKNQEVSKNAETEDGKKVIRLNWWGGDTRHTATLEAIEAFEKAHPDVEVKAEYEAWTGHEEKVAMAINGGTAADVMQINWSWPYQYSPNGDKFLDINTVSDYINLDNYEQADLDALTVGGALQGVPISTTGRCFFWNKTTFDKVGAEIPTDMDSLMAAGKAFAEYEDGSYYPLCLYQSERFQFLVYYLECKYGKDWVTDNQLNYTEEEFIDGLNFINSLEENHVIPTLSQVAGDGADSLDKNPKWMSGKYAGIYEWDSSAGKYKDSLESEDEFIVGDFMSLGEYQGGFVKISQAFAISANTSYPEECAQLIEFMLASEEGVEILGDTRGVPANKAGLAILESSLEGNLTAEANKKVVEWSKFTLDPKFENPALRSADGAYYLGLEMLSSGEAPEEVADYMLTAIKEELEKD